MIKKVADSKYTMLFMGFISTIMLIIITAIITDGLAEIKQTINQTTINTYQVKENTDCLERHKVKIHKIENKVFPMGG